MREHQIVITLKPDQFLEVQRLARAANAKSMGAFVRQKLLAALGIEGSLGDEHAAPGAGAANGVASDVDIEAVLNDLKRVHADLKTFVAESLSPYSPEAFGQVEQPTPEPLPLPAPAFDVVSPAVPDQTAETEEPLDNDELEKLADRTFAISPRLGPIGDPSPQQNAANSKDERILLARHELHSRRDVHRYHHTPGPLEAMDEPFNADEPAQPVSANPLDDISADNFFDDAPPAVPARPVVPNALPAVPAVDPLSKLLSHEDMVARTIPKTQSLDDDDDTFDVPLSISERRRMLEDSDEQPVYREPPHPGLQPTLPSEMPLETPAPAPTVPPIANEVSSSPPVEAPPPETGTTPASSPTAPAQNPPGAPLGYPPLSGSPPPKRRQV